MPTPVVKQDNIPLLTTLNSQLDLNKIQSLTAYIHMNRFGANCLATSLNKLCEVLDFT